MNSRTVVNLDTTHLSQGAGPADGPPSSQKPARQAGLSPDEKDRVLLSYEEALEAFHLRELQEAPDIISANEAAIANQMCTTLQRPWQPVPMVISEGPRARRAAAVCWGKGKTKSAPVYCKPDILSKFSKVAPFVTWAALRRNQHARDMGRAMFLNDPTSNETIMWQHDDSDGLAEAEEADPHAAPLPWEKKNAEQVNHAILVAANSCGQPWTRTLDVLADRLEVVPKKLSDHLIHLQPRVADNHGQDAEDGLDPVDLFLDVFCRRCHMYSCRLHGGGQVRPHVRPAEYPAAEGEPCGPDCWRSVGASGSGRLQPEGLAENTTTDPAPVHLQGSNGVLRGREDGGAAERDAAPVHKRPRRDGLAPEPATNGRPDGDALKTGAVSHGVRERAGAGGAAADNGAASGSHRPSSASGAPLGPLANGGGGKDGGSGGGGGGVGTEKAVATDGGRRDAGGTGPSGRGGAGGTGAGGTGRGEGRSGGSRGRSGAEGPAAAWSAWDLLLLKRACGAVSAASCCAVARLLGPRHSCAQVHQQLQRSQLTMPAPPPPRLVKASKSTQAPAIKERLLRQKARTDAGVSINAHEPWDAYMPCVCRGSCTKDCACAHSGNYCEKFCACDLSCANRAGCVCKKGECRNQQCPCVAADRECDPDLCRGCIGACEPPPEGAAGASDGRRCLNMKMRMRQHMRISVAPSTVAGWGAFLHHPVAQKDDFLGEYTGEVITVGEAERRSGVYHHSNSSYLFTLNKQWALDARNFGNKLRMANHATTPAAGENCFARYLQVDGDHRVGIYAKRRIECGEELFYNYGTGFFSGKTQLKGHESD